MNDNLFNNELTNYRDNFDFFVNLYLNNKLPQAFILSGENGIGKLNFIYHMLNFIFSVNDEYKYDLKNYKINPSNKTYKLLSQNSHPNLFFVSPSQNKKNIEIAQIKKMQNYLNMSTFDKLPKIILINKCETLNISSSNSLLKSLEEKYENVYFILIHDIKKILLSTIKSRCVQFKIFLSNEERIKKIEEIIGDQYQSLSLDFKDKYLSMNFYRDLQFYCKDNNLEIKTIDLNKLFLTIFEKQNLKNNQFVSNNLFLLIQLFLYKYFKSNFNNAKYFSLLKYFYQRFEDVKKYNLELESLMLEFKYLIYDKK